MWPRARQKQFLAGESNNNNNNNKMVRIVHVTQSHDELTQNEMANDNNKNT